VAVVSREITPMRQESANTTVKLTKRYPMTTWIRCSQQRVMARRQSSVEKFLWWRTRRRWTVTPSRHPSK